MRQTARVVTLGIATVLLMSGCGQSGQDRADARAAGRQTARDAAKSAADGAQVWVGTVIGYSGGLTNDAISVDYGGTSTADVKLEGIQALSRSCDPGVAAHAEDNFNSYLRKLAPVGMRVAVIRSDMGTTEGPGVVLPVTAGTKPNMHAQSLNERMITARVAAPDPWVDDIYPTVSEVAANAKAALAPADFSWWVKLSKVASPALRLSC